MTIGSLGDIMFCVSNDKVLTIDNMGWSGSARYAVHNRVGQNALTEFIGIDPDKITFDITLSAYLGISVVDTIAKIFAYERNGTPVGFVLGEKTYGKYRWNIVSHSLKGKTYDEHGNMTSATVSVTLQEYLRR